MDIILASTSPYRKQLLERLGLQFSCMAPEMDEEKLKSEILATDPDPAELAKQLGRAKAQSIAQEHPDAIVIGSDQLAHLDEQILGKPGSAERAIEQLSKMAGKTHRLITAVTILHQGQSFEHVDNTTLYMHALNAEAITRYVQHDQPLNCAGSYKLEAAGISLFDRIDSDDHSAITGLPLLFVCKILRQLGVKLP